MCSRCKETHNVVLTVQLNTCNCKPHVGHRKSVPLTWACTPAARLNTAASVRNLKVMLFCVLCKTLLREYRAVEYAFAYVM